MFDGVLNRLGVGCELKGIGAGAAVVVDNVDAHLGNRWRAGRSPGVAVGAVVPGVAFVTFAGIEGYLGSLAHRRVAANFNRGEVVQHNFGALKVGAGATHLVGEVDKDVFVAFGQPVVNGYDGNGDAYLVREKHHAVVQEIVINPVGGCAGDAVEHHPRSNGVGKREGNPQIGLGAALHGKGFAAGGGVKRL